MISIAVSAMKSPARVVFSSVRGSKESVILRPLP
jgi:hypothetical protein